MKLQIAVIILLGLIGLGAVAAVGYGLQATGPNCPGMDPSYLGWCK